jgi:Uncharacterized conserved protein
MTDTTQVAKEKLLHDFNEVVADTEQLLKSVAAVGGEKTQALRANVEQSLKVAKEKLRDIQETRPSARAPPRRRRTSTCTIIRGSRSRSWRACPR